MKPSCPVEPALHQHEEPGVLHYCMIDIEKIKAMTIAKVGPQDPLAAQRLLRATPCAKCFYQTNLAVQLTLLGSEESQLSLP